MLGWTEAEFTAPLSWNGTRSFRETSFKSSKSSCPPRTCWALPLIAASRSDCRIGMIPADPIAELRFVTLGDVSFHLPPTPTEDTRWPFNRNLAGALTLR